MWPDLDYERVDLFDRRPAGIDKLPRTTERLDAAGFFARHLIPSWMKEDAKRYADAVTWLNWAAIVALVSAGDTLKHDLRDMGLKALWKKSPEFREMNAHPLLTVFKGLRNHEVHFEFHESNIRNTEWVIEGVTYSGELEFFTPLNLTFVSPGRQRRDDDIVITPDHIEWFNRQAAILPASILIGMGKKFIASYVAAFLERALKDVAGAETAV